MALGDDLAAGLGECTRRTRLLAFAGAVVLCGVDHRWLLPASALAGAVLLTTADVAGRVIARPEEIDAGVITAFIGAPLFIWIVRRQKVRAL